MTGRRIVKRRKGIISLISLVVVLFIIGFLLYLSYNIYINNRKTSVHVPGENLSGREDDLSGTEAGVLSRSKRKADIIKKESEKRSRDIEELGY